MKKIVLLAALALSPLAAPAIAQEGAEIRIATEGAYPPFNFVDADGSLKGLDVEIANALCAEMKAKCTIVAQEWDGMIPGLIAKKYDAIVASMSITEERKKQVDFTDKYYTTPLAVIAPKDSDLAGVAPADLDGKTIGTQGATTQAEYADTHYGTAGADVRSYPTNDEATADLVNGRLDALISDKLQIAPWLEKDGKECCKMISDVPGTETEAGIAVRKDEGELKTRLNKALEAIRANGTYAQITGKYFAFDIY